MSLIRVYWIITSCVSCSLPCFSAYPFGTGPLEKDTCFLGACFKAIYFHLMAGIKIPHCFIYQSCLNATDDFRHRRVIMILILKSAKDYIYSVIK